MQDDIDIDDEISGNFNEISDYFELQVAAAIIADGQKRKRVIYSIFEKGEDNRYIDNLNNIAAEGRIQLVQHPDKYWGGNKSKKYESEILTNPTWLQIAVCANKMIELTRDVHHCFFEGISLVETIDDVKIYEFVMGS